jgi:hypothetical protein
LDRVQVIRDEARLLKREPEIGQQDRHVVDVVRDLELPRDDLLDQQGVPTAGLEPRRLRPGGDDLGQPLLLGLGQLRGPTTAPAYAESVHALQEEGMHPAVQRGPTDPHAAAGVVHPLATGQAEQGGHPLDEGEIPGLEGSTQD